MDLFAVCRPLFNHGIVLLEGSVTLLPARRRPLTPISVAFAGPGDSSTQVVHDENAQISKITAGHATTILAILSCFPC